MTLRDIARDCLRKRGSKCLCAFAPAILLPSDKVASALIPTSIPTIAWFSLTFGISSVSTVMLTNHLSARRETVAFIALPVKRTDSRIRTQPKFGIHRRLLSVLNWSLESSKLSRMPFFLKRGNCVCFLKKRWNASPKSIIASCGAHLVTSNIQGNCSRLMLLSSLRSAPSLTVSPAS